MTCDSRHTPSLSLFPSLSQWQMTESSHELSKKQFDVWVASHCPRLTEGIQHWIHSLLLTTPHMLERAEQGVGHAEEGEAPHSSGATVRLSLSLSLSLSLIPSSLLPHRPSISTTTFPLHLSVSKISHEEEWSCRLSYGLCPLASLSSTWATERTERSTLRLV